MGGALLGLHLREDRLEVLGVPNGPLRGELAQANGRLIDPEDVLGPPQRGKTFVIIGDAEPRRGADVLVIEATFSQTRCTHCARLWTAVEAAQLAAAGDVQQLVLTQISGRYPDEEILTEAAKVFPNSRIATDFDRVVI
jgi:ribonuclease Z